MRQEFGDQMVFVRGQALQHILEVSVRIVAVEPGALNQAHDGSRTPACPQEACEKPVLSPDGYGPGLVFCPDVVDRQLPVIRETRVCAPALKTVVQRFDRSRAVCDLPALQFHPLMQCVGQWPGAGLANPQPFIRCQIFNLALNVIKRADGLQRLRCNLALVADVQVKELSPRMRHAP